VAEEDDLVTVVSETSNHVPDGGDILGKTGQGQLRAADARQGDMVILVSGLGEHGSEVVPRGRQLPRAGDDDDRGQSGGRHG
jgi:hydrogenase maturation factor